MEHTPNPDEEEVALTLADMEDDADFATRYAEWDIKERIPLAPDALRKICRIWYGAGIERGSQWALDDFERKMRAEKE
jgi:hypothetical protein